MPATKQFLGLIGWLLLCFAAAGVGAVASVRATEFYGELAQPFWAPPSSVFGPVWSVLYTAMGVAAWLVWREGGFRLQGRALALFIAQLAANAAWTWLFFAWHRGAWALADICLLWLLIASTLVVFWRVRRTAGALLIPYLAWVSFATALNYSLLELNPQVLS